MNYVTKQVCADRNDDIGAPQPILTLDVTHDCFTAYLHEEMRQCYLAELYHAAILMACSLVEYFVKDLIYLEAFLQDGRQFSLKKWQDIEKKQWQETMRYAKSLGLITKEGWKHLSNFADTVRNPYMHGSTPAYVKNLKVPIVRGNWQTTEAKTVVVTLEEDLPLQRMFRIVEDRRMCDYAVKFADDVVRKGAIFEQARLRMYEEVNPPERPSTQQLDSLMGAMRAAGFDGTTCVIQQLPEDLTR